MADFNFTIEDVWVSGYDFEFEAQSEFAIYKIFRGSNNHFNSIWADSEASLSNGKFYVGRQEDLTIVNNTNSQAYVEDYYSKTTKGSSEDALSAEDQIDINVTY